VVVVQDAAAQVKDHRPMPADQGGEGRLVVSEGEPFQQFTVGQFGRRVGRHLADVPEDWVLLAVRHRLDSRKGGQVSLLRFSPRRRFAGTFFLIGPQGISQGVVVRKVDESNLGFAIQPL
jgi:hypothetical protein